VRIQFNPSDPSRVTEINFDAAFTHFQGYSEDGKNTIEANRDRLIAQNSFAAEMDAEKAISQRPMPQYNNNTSLLSSKPMTAAAQANAANANARRMEQDQKNRNRLIADAANSAFWRSETELKKTKLSSNPTPIPRVSPLPLAIPTSVINEAALERKFAANENLAKYGNTKAMCELGKSYEDGKGVGKDLRRAAEWYAKAAAGKDTNGMYNLGWCFEHEIGVPNDPKQAVGYYQQAADGGHAGAMNRLALCFVNGIGVSKDVAKAIEWFKRAADAGYSQSMCSLGVCFRDGIGISKDETKAIEWFKRAADAGNGLAMSYLGNLYLNSEPKHPQKAVEWFRKGAEAGHIGATVNLGYCYQTGLGVPQNAVLASQCFLKGANAGDEKGMNNIGLNLVYGRGIPKNYNKGIDWLKRSAAAGYEPANKTLHSLEQDKQTRQLLVLGVLAAALSGSHFEAGNDSQHSSNDVSRREILDKDGHPFNNERDRDRSNEQREERIIESNKRIQGL
jgi:TPR repeat protein